MEKHLVASYRVWLLTIFIISTMLLTSVARASEIEQIWRGFEIAPVSLNLKGKNWELVGLGSYLVNTTGCNDCHTWPNWADGHNPYLPNQQSEQINEQINTPGYMAGGRVFLKSDGQTVLAVSANITPDKNDRPAGLTLAGFLEVMHTGHDPRDPPNDILQVMPWPLYRWKTDEDLLAIYEYLRAIPSIPAH
jgi:hypothetical protein